MTDTLWVGTATPLTQTFPFEQILARHERVRDAIADSGHGKEIDVQELPKFVALQTFVYAFNSYKAAGLLLPHLYHESAAVVVRQLWEVSLNLHWLERDPPTRALDFCNFTVMEYRKLLQKRGDSSLKAFDDATSPFQSRFRFQDRNGRDKQHTAFATKSVSDRASEIGNPWNQEYGLIYNLTSMHVHGAPGAILHALFQQNYDAPDVRERNSASLIALLSMSVIVRDFRLLVRLGVFPDSTVVDAAFEAASDENIVHHWPI